MGFSGGSEQGKPMAALPELIKLIISKIHTGQSKTLYRTFFLNQTPNILPLHTSQKQAV
ncbi:hypothetical protein [Desulfonema magnum]|uniref:SAM-dependent methyltransferase n=1 Tax=Desulfonema magnum TaxID=45655 RepID=A0A975BGA7_9BACT|nr:hypothetical protein [Desulfonema magnum]QTA84669.1 SAM-dependent methyltransferase [Desulfonema magnum]